MAHSGKDKPCHCKSGIPYEACCGKEESVTSAGWVPHVIEGGQKDNHHAFSIDQLNSVLNSVMRAENERLREEFCGLSSIDISSLLYHPFDSPDVVKFCTDIKDIPDSPFMELFLKLLNVCEGKGTKLTATGNLPRNFCRETALDYYSLDEIYDDKFIIRFINSETHFDELHTVNIISKMAGYTRKYRNRLLLTKKGQQVLKKGISGKDFLNIFRKYSFKFNWAYRDRGEDLHIVQTAFLFTLFILKKYGDIFRETAFYNGLFLKAFPMSLNEVPERDYSSPEEDVSSSYSMRSLERFAWFFGFADFNVSERKFFRKTCQIKKTSFLDNFIKFYK
jgi:hypothetical protein